jgi:hypothetical protein
MLPTYIISSNLLVKPRDITLVEPSPREILLGTRPYSYLNKGITP